MAADAQIVTASIDDYLLALADGIYQAQKQLSRVSVEGQPGQPSITYQLPRVDFEFRVTFALSESTVGGGDEAARKQIQIRPADAVGSRAATMASTIKGTFVAVPAGGGKPPSRLSTDVSRVTSKRGREYTVRARVQLATGEPVPGTRVEFNIDRELSARIPNRRTPGAAVSLCQGTRLEFGVRQTDERGYAETSLKIDEAELSGACIAVQVNAVDAEDVLVFEVPDPSGGAGQ